MSKETRRAVIQNIGYLTQLGFSIAFPPILCTMGAMWLRDRHGLGGWIVAVGIIFGIAGGLSSFGTFARTMIKRMGKDDDKSHGPRD